MSDHSRMARAQSPFVRKCGPDGLVGDLLHVREFDHPFLDEP